jgi:hypothetical protein
LSPMSAAPRNHSPIESPSSSSAFKTKSLNPHASLRRVVRPRSHRFIGEVLGALAPTGANIVQRKLAAPGPEAVGTPGSGQCQRRRLASYGYPSWRVAVGLSAISRWGKAGREACRGNTGWGSG